MIEATVEEGDSKQATSSKKRLTDEEITRHSITFMLAGYETTANALSYTAYLLALNPHVQEKMQEEVDSYFQENPVCLDLVQYSFQIMKEGPLFGGKSYEKKTLN